MVGLKLFSHFRALKSQQRFGQLAFEITIILAIKLLLLWALWAACFSHAMPKDSRQAAVSQLILNQSH